MSANETFDDTAMSDKDLEALLRLELEREDPTLTLQVLESLSRRQPEKPGEAEAAWARFETHYLPLEESLYGDGAERPAKKRRRFWLRAASLAAAVSMSVWLLAVQVGGSDPATRFARWTTDRFTFGQTNLLPEAEKEPEEGNPPQNFSTESSDPILCDSLEEAVTELGLEGDLIPNWLPEGYALESAEVRHLAGSSAMYAYYTASKEQFIRFRYCRDHPDSSGGVSIHEKDDTPVETYERDGVLYYFLSNEGYESVTWMLDDLTECSIGGGLPREELRKIVDSLYEASDPTVAASPDTPEA